MIHEDRLRFGEFYILPELQGGGLGTRILRHCLRYADNLGYPVKLERLKWNQVGTLYQREGFQKVGEADIHVLMERPTPDVPNVR